MRITKHDSHLMSIQNKQHLDSFVVVIRKRDTTDFYRRLKNDYT